MDLSKLTSSSNEFYTLVEISMNSHPVKYEFDKEVGCMVVDRFMPTSMVYPCNYGFMPNTLSGDGDPLDVLVYTSLPIVAGSLIKVRPIGVLETEDESGFDEKVLAVPTIKIDPSFDKVKEYTDLPEIFIKKIEHFFTRYKELEKNKWVKVKGWHGAEKSFAIVEQAIKNYGR